MGSVAIAGTVLLTSWLCQEMHPMAKMAYLATMAEMAINHQIETKIQITWQRGPFESGDFGENGVFGENCRNGD